MTYYIPLFFQFIRVCDLFPWWRHTITELTDSLLTDRETAP